MRRFVTTYALTATLALSVSGVPALAQAAAPANDDWQSPTHLAVNATISQDASDATADTTPPSAAGCHGANHSVWFRLTSNVDRPPLVVSTAGSDYDTVLNLYRANRPGHWTRLRCDDDSGPGPTSQVNLTMRAGAVYYVMVGSYGRHRAGELRLSVRPRVTAAMTLDPHAHWDPVDGSAVVHGTVRCSRSARAHVYVALRQRVAGVYIADGDGQHRFGCRRTARTWSLHLFPYSGIAFQRGPARVLQTFWRVCSPPRHGCTGPRQFARATVRLR